MNNIILKNNLKLLLSSPSKEAEEIGVFIITNAVVFNNKDDIKLIKTTLGINLFNYYFNIIKERFNNI